MSTERIEQIEKSCHKEIAGDVAYLIFGEELAKSDLVKHIVGCALTNCGMWDTIQKHFSQVDDVYEKIEDEKRATMKGSDKL